MVPCASGAPSTVADPDAARMPCSKSGSSATSTSAPAASARSTPTSGVCAVPGDVAPPNEPISTVAVTPSEEKPGSVAWCSNAGATSRDASGSTTHNWAPCRNRGCTAGDCSECAMPCPAVISANSPGPNVTSLPIESRWCTSPSSSQDTVCNPVCGCGATCMPGDDVTSSGP